MRIACLLFLARPPTAPALDYQLLPKQCNPCCSANAHPINKNGPDRCGDGQCPAEANALDGVPCAINFNDDATLTNGEGSSGGGPGTGDSFVYHTDLAYRRGMDGFAYLEKNVRRSEPTGHRNFWQHPRYPCTSGFCANACSPYWSSLLIYLGDEYRVAEGNEVRVGGWGTGHMECGGHMSEGRHGATSASQDYTQNNYHEVPNFDTYSIDKCIGATWKRLQRKGGLLGNLGMGNLCSPVYRVCPWDGHGLSFWLSTYMKSWSLNPMSSVGS